MPLSVTHVYVLPLTGGTMADLIAATQALMDAGVPGTTPIRGIPTEFSLSMPTQLVAVDGGRTLTNPAPGVV